ncbi:MAG: hypothetical protein PHX51_07650 [Clostridia bacterium]|nr:hypothetical protein [Clostridia bacterium]
MKDKIICIVAMSIAVIYCLGLIFSASGSVLPTDSTDSEDTAQTSSVSMEYADKIFSSDSVHIVNIEIMKRQQMIRRWTTEY